MTTLREKAMWLMENGMWPHGQTRKASDYFGAIFSLIREKEEETKECRCLELYENSLTAMGIPVEKWPVFIGKHPLCEAHERGDSGPFAPGTK